MAAEAQGRDEREEMGARNDMAIQNAEDLFLTMLSNVRSREERVQQILGELSQQAEDPDVKQMLETRSFIQKEVISNLDECFRQIGRQPMQPTGAEVRETFVEDFRRVINEIQQPALRAIYAYHKASEVVQWHAASYAALTAMADVTGHYSVGLLLETCLADKIAFAERTKRAIRALGQAAVAGRMLRVAA